MSRIHIGLIGLSTSSQSTNWAANAHLPYLQSEQGQKHFEIVALCNSSIESAKKSIEHYKLPSSLKTYDSPADLANDVDVDLVVNVTGVEQHHGVLLPVVQAGKNVYTELPLAVEMDQMQELLQTAKEKKIKTVFGMQGNTSVVIKVLKGIITDGKIGKVLSSSWTGAAGMLGEDPTAVGLRGMVERKGPKSGANLMTVFFLHSINYILATLGELTAFHSILGNQRPTATLIDPSKDGKVVETVSKDAPDQVFLQGRLESGALLSYHLRGGAPFPGQPGVIWHIYGEKGEIFVTNPAMVLDIMHQGVSIKVHVFGEKEAQDVELPKDEMSGLPHPCQNVGQIYEAYARGQEGGDGGYPDWELGMKRHELIEEMWERADGGEASGEAVKQM